MDEEEEDYRVRIDPFRRMVKFCQLFNPHLDERTNLSENAILQLVFEHLARSGLLQSLSALEEESKSYFADSQPQLAETSKLTSMVRSSMQLVDEIYNFIMAYPKDKPSELEELLFRFGLLEDTDSNERELSNLWEEKSEVQYAQDGSVKAASVNQLLLKLTSEVESDVQFLKTFLMTYQSFIQPKMFLAKLMERFDIPPNVVSAVDAVKIKSRCVNVLKQWMNAYYDDFNEEMIAVLDRFVHEVGGVLSDSLRQPLSRLKKIRNGEAIDTSSKNTGSSPPPEPIVDLKSIFLPEFCITMLHPQEIARQLTLYFQESFSKIRPCELLNLSWTRPNRLIKAPNVCKMTQKFNHISYMVCFDIVSPKTPRVRAVHWRLWVKVATHLWKLNNFTGAMSVLAAFNMSATYRLKSTVKELPPKVKQKQAELEKMMKSTSSYKAYREHLNSVAPPAIPFLGLLLTDLTFTETNPNTTAEGLILWSKRTKLFNLIESTFLRFQQPHFNLTVLPQVSRVLEQPQSYSESELFNLSLQREPRTE